MYLVSEMEMEIETTLCIEKKLGIGWDGKG